MLLVQYAPAFEEMQSTDFEEKTAPTNVAATERSSSMQSEIEHCAGMSPRDTKSPIAPGTRESSEPLTQPSTLAHLSLIHI